MRRLRIRRTSSTDDYGFLDLIQEAVSDIGTRPGRAVMTLAGTVFGVGALVATVGLSQTSAVQVERQFQAATTSQAVVRSVEVTDSSGESVPVRDLPWDAADRLSRLSGVRGAAATTVIDPEGIEIEAVQMHDPRAPAVVPPPLVAVSGDLLEAVGGVTSSGRVFDSGHDARGDRVAVLGIRAAEQFGLTNIDSQPSIFIAGHAYAVIGILDEVRARGELLTSVMIPTGAARHDLDLRAQGEVNVHLMPGAGADVARQAPLAVAPDHPEDVEVAAPTGASNLQQSVQSDLGFVFLVLSLVMLLAAGLGITAVTTLSVSERTAEIGLRRALGATKRQIAGQFMMESAILGAVGGIVGAAVAVGAIIAVSVGSGWAPVTDVWVAIGGPVAGVLVGVLAGASPALRASRIEPVEALRG